ncbi:high affinity glucose transporter [Friedmanniomyces endolithicus]|nr:high affinity glucose transporter [Friedmanniomyces endolithicus]
MVKQFGNIYLIAGIAIIGGGLFGFDISSMSAIIAGQGYLCYFNQGNKSCTGPSSSTQGGITASMAAGSWLASLCSGFVSDAFGRKKAIMLGALIWVVGCIIVSASQNIAMLIVGRIINGFCVGICSAQVPVYISELAPPTKRGRLVGAQQWAITWGILIMFYISYGCSSLKGSAAFRIPWALQMIPAIILFFGMMVLPESPRWLASKDRWEECERVLVLVHGHGDPNSPWVAREFREIKEWLEIERQSKQISYLTLFTPRYINRTHIGLFTQIWSQLTGMNVMMYYITYVFTMAGLTGSTLLLSSSIQYVINVAMTVPALIWIDRVGRRPTLLAGSILMATWLFVNAAVLGAKGVAVPGGVGGIKEAKVQVTGAASKAVIACSYLFVASYAPTWGPVSWIYPPELAKAVFSSCAALEIELIAMFSFRTNCAGRPMPLQLPATGPLTTWLWKTYIIFGIFCVAMTIHVYFMFPETAGKPLEEVNAMFEDPSGPKYIGTPAWKTKNYYNTSARMEQGEGLEKQIHDDEAAVRHEEV